MLQAQQTLFSAEDQLVQQVLANRLSAIHLYEALAGDGPNVPKTGPSSPNRTSPDNSAVMWRYFFGASIMVTRPTLVSPAIRLSWGSNTQ